MRGHTAYLQELSRIAARSASRPAIDHGPVCWRECYAPMAAPLDDRLGFWYEEIDAGDTDSWLG